jgi:hypothetical protein
MEKSAVITSSNDGRIESCLRDWCIWDFSILSGRSIAPTFGKEGKAGPEDLANNNSTLDVSRLDSMTTVNLPIYLFDGLE